MGYPLLPSLVSAADTVFNLALESNDLFNPNGQRYGKADIRHPAASFALSRGAMVSGA